MCWLACLYFSYLTTIIFRTTSRSYLKIDYSWIFQKCTYSKLLVFWKFGQLKVVLICRMYFWNMFYEKEKSVALRSFNILLYVLCEMNNMVSEEMKNKSCIYGNYLHFIFSWYIGFYQIRNCLINSESRQQEYWICVKYQIVCSVFRIVDTLNICTVI